MSLGCECVSANELCLLLYTIGAVRVCFACVNCVITTTMAIFFLLLCFFFFLLVLAHGMGMIQCRVVFFLSLWVVACWQLWPQINETIGRQVRLFL